MKEGRIEALKEERVVGLKEGSAEGSCRVGGSTKGRKEGRAERSKG